MGMVAEIDTTQTPGLTPDTLTKIKNRIAMGEAMSEIAKELGISRGTIASRLSREQHRLDFRKRAESTMQQAVQRYAQRVSVHAANKIDKLLEGAVATANTFRTLAEAKAREAKTINDLKTASECYLTPIKLVIEAYGIGKQETASDPRGSVTVQVGMMPQRDTVNAVIEG